MKVQWQVRSDTQKSQYVDTQTENRTRYLNASEALISKLVGDCTQFAELMYGRAQTVYGWLSDKYPGNVPCCVATVSRNVIDFSLNEISNAIALAPDRSDWLTYRADLYEQIEDKQNALKDYNTAISASPENWSALEDRARLLYLMGRYDDAVADAKAVIANASDPNTVEGAEQTLSAAKQSGGKDKSQSNAGSTNVTSSDSGRYSYLATISCGRSGMNMNVIACFAKSGRYGADTDLSVTRDGTQRLYKFYDVAQIPATSGSVVIGSNSDFPDGMIVDDDGLHILLPQSFEIVAQNSQEHLVMGISIININTRESVYQQEVGQYGVIKVGN